MSNPAAASTAFSTGGVSSFTVRHLHYPIPSPRSGIASLLYFPIHKQTPHSMSCYLLDVLFQTLPSSPSSAPLPSLPAPPGLYPRTPHHHLCRPPFPPPLLRHHFYSRHLGPIRGKSQAGGCLCTRVPQEGRYFISSGLGQGEGKGGRERDGAHSFTLYDYGMRGCQSDRNEVMSRGREGGRESVWSPGTHTQSSLSHSPPTHPTHVVITYIHAVTRCICRGQAHGAAAGGR